MSSKDFLVRYLRKPEIKSIPKTISNEDIVCHYCQESGKFYTPACTLWKGIERYNI